MPSKNINTDYHFLDTSKITNLPTPTASHHAATKGYVDGLVSGGGSVGDGDKGDITVSGTGTVWTIDPNAVINAKLATVATATFKGRTTAGTGDVEDLTATQATALLNTFTSSLKGLAPSSGGGTVNFLRADGAWATPAGAGDVVGPGSATDNAIARFDLTTGKLIQNSVVTIADSNGNMAGVGTVNTHTIPGGTDTFALLAASQSLSNKTLAGATNTITPIDTNFTITGSADLTKIVRFEVDGLTTGTTRVLTVPDANIVLAGSASALTSGRIPFVTTGGLLTDSANATLNSSGQATFLNVGINTAVTSSALSIAGDFEFIGASAQLFIRGGGATKQGKMYQTAGDEFIIGANAVSNIFRVNLNGADSALYVGSAGGTDGFIGINNSAPGAQLGVKSSGAAVIGQIIKGAASQSANLTEWQNSAGTVLARFDSAGYLGIGAAPLSPFHVEATLSTNIFGARVVMSSASGEGNGLYVKGGGTNSGRAIAQFDDASANTWLTLLATGTQVLGDGANYSFGTTTGTKIGTSTSQKLAFHDATPVILRAGAAQAAVATTAATNIAPFGYTTAAQADAIVTLVNEIRAALVEKGLIKGSA